MAMPPPALSEVLSHPLPAYYISIAMVMAPAVRILRRAGLKTWYVATLLVPFFGCVILPAMLALNNWPALPVRPKRKKKGVAA
ncbi:MAG: hypothetical protein GC185_04295 [Alphaproteobacteria bacterium]|nr:hypothetical protein [Alphaproteobacteria bacterium]